MAKNKKVHHLKIGKKRRLRFVGRVRSRGLLARLSKRLLGTSLPLVFILIASPFWTTSHPQFTTHHKFTTQNLDDGFHGVRCAVQDGQVVLTWKVGFDRSCKNPQGYRIFRALSPGGAPILVQTVPVPSGLWARQTMSVVDKPPSSATWYYEIQAFRNKPYASGAYIKAACIDY